VGAHVDADALLALVAEGAPPDLPVLGPGVPA
jgi:hypothetical protein